MTYYNQSCLQNKLTISKNSLASSDDFNRKCYNIWCFTSSSISPSLAVMWAPKFLFKINSGVRKTQTLTITSQLASWNAKIRRDFKRKHKITMSLNNLLWFSALTAETFWRISLRSFKYLGPVTPLRSQRLSRDLTLQDVHLCVKANRI